LTKPFDFIGDKGIKELFGEFRVANDVIVDEENGLPIVKCIDLPEDFLYRAAAIGMTEERGN